MKKLRLIIFSVICFLLMPLVAWAATGTVKVTGSSSAVVGNKVTLTVTLSSSTAMGSWQLNLNYDKSYLQLTSSSAEAGGTAMVGYSASSNGVKTKTYTFVFKALKKGTTTVAIGSYDVYAMADFSEINLSVTNKTIRIMTQAELEASYSKDNYLKSLQVDGYELTPTFDKEKLEYYVTVPENTKTVTIKATANDSKSKIEGIGNMEVTSGINTFNVIVRAENGSERTYTLSVEVKDSNPIIVSVEDKNYTVVKIRENLETPEAFEETTVTINDFEIPAYYNETTNITLVGLKDEVGSIEYFIYDSNANTYEVYNELNLNKIVLYPKETDKTLDNFELGKAVINEIEVPAYYINKDSKLAIIYAVNIDNGIEGFYIYDKDNNTAVLFSADWLDLLNDSNEKIELYSYIIIGFSAIVVIMFILLIKKSKKNKQPKKVVGEEKNIVEEVKNDDKEELVQSQAKVKKDKKNKKEKTEPITEDVETNEKTVEVSKSDLEKISEENKQIEETDDDDEIFEDLVKRKKNRNKKSKN